MFLLGTNFMINGSLARSGRPGSGESDWMGNLSISHTMDLYDWIVRYSDIGAGFNPGTGFIQRPDQRSLLTNVHFKPRPGWKGVRQIYIGNVYRRIENHDGVLETRTIRPGFLVIFQTEDSMMTLYYDTFDYIPYSFEIAPGVTIPSGEYRNRQSYITLSTNHSRRIALDADYTGGGFYGGEIHSASLALVFKPMSRLHISTQYNLDSVDLPGGSFDSVISTLLVSYHFSPTLTTRVAAQYSSLLEDFVFNFRLRWIYGPESEAWLVYDEGRRFGLEGSSLRDRALIMKIVYNFNF